MTGREFGERIYRMRKDRKLTQNSLGGLVGVTDKAVSKWEREGIIPQMDVLLRLTKALNVDIMELLGEEEPSIPLEGRDLISRRRELWKAAEERLYRIYGDEAPLTVLNRFGQEMSLLSDTNAILFFDILRELWKESEKQEKQINGPGTLHESFTAWLMGATPVNPLPPHYYCPACRRTEFVRDAADGWDLPEKQCECGKKMQRDGHDLPFGVCACGNSTPYASNELYISLSFLEEAQRILLRLAGPYFSLRRFVMPVYSEKDSPYTCIFLEAKDPDKKTPDYIEDIERVENVYNWGTSTAYPAFRFFPLPDPKRTGRKAKPRTPSLHDLTREEVLIRALKKQYSYQKEQWGRPEDDYPLRDAEKYREGITFGRFISLLCAINNAYMEDSEEAMAEALGMTDPTGFPVSQEDLWKLILRCAGNKGPADGSATLILMKCRNGDYTEGITERDSIIFSQLKLPESFPEYAKRVIHLCRRSERTEKGIKLLKEVWQRMQVEK